jgi:hypothetical protein
MLSLCFIYPRSDPGHQPENTKKKRKRKKRGRKSTNEERTTFGGQPTALELSDHLP